MWLAPRVWATHGHYLNRHLVPAVDLRDVARPARRSPLERRLPGRLRAARPPVADPGDAVAAPTAGGAVLRPGRARPGLDDAARETAPAASPDRAADLGAARAADAAREHPGLGRVVRELGVDADWVVFGHVHRLGPIGGGRPSAVARRAAADRRSSTPGSWLYEPLLVHRATPPHPYWPGGAVLLEDDERAASRSACSMTFTASELR